MLYQVAIGNMIGHWSALRIFALCSREREDTELPRIQNYHGLPYMCTHINFSNFGLCTHANVACI